MFCIASCLIISIAATAAGFLQPRMEIVPNQGHYSDARRIEVCAGGRLAVTQPEFRDDAPDDPIKIWDLLSGRLLRNIQGCDFALSPDKNILYVNRFSDNQEAALSAAPLVVIDLSSGGMLDPPAWKRRVVQISEDGRFGLSHDFLRDDYDARDAFVFDMRTGKKLFDFRSPLICVSSDFSIAILRGSGEGIVYSLLKNRTLCAIAGKRFSVSNDGRAVVSLTRAGEARIWRAGSNRVFTLKDEYIRVLSLSGNGRYALLERRDGSVDSLDIATLQKRELSEGASKGRILASAFRAGGSRALILRSSGGADATVELRICDPASGTLQQNILLEGAEKGDIEDGEATIDSETGMIVGGGLEAFHCWRFDSSPPIHASSKLGSSYIPSDCISNNRGDIIICRQFYDEETSRLTIWDLEKGVLTAPSELQGPDAPQLEAARLSGSLAAFRNGSGFDIYDLKSGRAKGRIPGKRIALSADDRRAVAVGTDGTLFLYDLRTMMRIAVFPAAVKNIKECAVNKDGSIAAVLDESGEITIWNCISSARVPMQPHSGVKSFALGSAGRTLATSHEGGSIGIWNAADGTLRRMIFNTGDVSVCRLSINEKKVLSVGNARAVLWNLETGEIIRSIDAAIAEPVVDVKTDDDLSFAAINGAVWDLNAERKLSPGAIGYSTIVPNTDAVVKATREGIELWSVLDGRLLATAANYDEQWIAYTPEGFYDASPGAERFISWRPSNGMRALGPVGEIMRERRRRGLLKMLTTKITKNNF